MREEKKPAIQAPAGLELIPPSTPTFLDEAPVPPENKWDERLSADVACEEFYSDQTEGDI